MKKFHAPLPLSLTCLLAALTPIHAAESAKNTDESLPIHLGLIENFTTADGSHLTMVVPLFHHFTNPDGSTNSFNLLNYLQWPGTTTVLPFYVRTGQEGQKHTWVIPLWCQGPGYAGAPLALSGGWKKPDGGTAMWITPFLHVNTRTDGTVDDAHALTYLQGKNYQVLFPLAYRAGLPERRYQGIIPLAFAGPDWWTAPLTLSGGWQHDDGGATTWITPLYHHSTDQRGTTTSLHVLSYVHTNNADVFFPLIWHGGTGETSYTGVLPLWWQGQHGGGSPALLSAWWRNDDGGTTTWMTPLAHVSTNGAGEVSSFHALNYLHTQNFDLFFPLAWSSGTGGTRSTVVLPLYWQGRDYQVVLPCYFRIGTGDQQQMGVFPFWFQGTNHLVIPPFYSVGSPENGYSRGVFPLWFQGDNWWMIPPLLSGRSTDTNGSSLWVTPLFHDQRRGNERRSHVLTYFSGHHGGGVDAKTGKPQPESSYHLVFPLFYRTSQDDGTATATNTGLIPFYFGGPDYWFAPLGLSGSWSTNDGDHTTWITPLFHQSSRADGSNSLHALLYAQGTEHGQPNAKGQPTHSEFRNIFPLYFHRSTTADGITTNRTALFPAWYSSPDCTIVPPLLSARLTNADGGDSLWITPLFHRTRNHQGDTTSLHALNYIQSGDRKLFFPLAYSSGGATPHQGLIPLWFNGPDYWTVPVALSGGWKRDDGGTSTWITPLAHVERSKDGNVERMHALTYFHDQDSDVVFPLAYSVGGSERHRGILPLWFGGPEYWTVPLALSGGWKNSSGGTSTWITPLAHVERSKDSTVERMHALTYYRDKDTEVLFPLAWRSGAEGQRHVGLLPLWLQGPQYWCSPLALSGGWTNADGGSTTWITPLAHRSADKNGNATDWHALNLIHFGDTDFFAPLAWRTGPEGQRHGAFFPLYWQGPDYCVLAPAFFKSQQSWIAPLALSARWNDGPERTTTVVTPLYHRTTDHGQVAHEHLLNYVGTPQLTTVLPLYWDWKNAAGSRTNMLPPLYVDHRRTDGERITTVLPPLLTYRSGKTVDTSLGYKLLPFLWQQADDGYEINALWRLFHVREHQQTADTAVWPLWWSERKAKQTTRWQILGGLIARENNEDTKTSRFYLFWMPIGKRTSFDS